MSHSHSREHTIWACILIGGKSSRMGRPKHLLHDEGGRSWLERMVSVVAPRVAHVVLSGPGEVPDALSALHRLPDIPTVKGPLTGILAAMNFRNDVTWLLLACDLPCLSDESLHWLLNQRTPGTWGVVPRVGKGRGVEPLFALYEPESIAIFEELRIKNELRISKVVDHEKIKVVEIPPELEYAWKNVNTPDELSHLS